MQGQISSFQQLTRPFLPAVHTVARLRILMGVSTTQATVTFFHNTSLASGLAFSLASPLTAQQPVLSCQPLSWGTACAYLSPAPSSRICCIRSISRAPPGQLAITCTRYTLGKKLLISSMHSFSSFSFKFTSLEIGTSASFTDHGKLGFRPVLLVLLIQVFFPTEAMPWPI